MFFPVKEYFPNKSFLFTLQLIVITDPDMIDIINFFILFSQ